MLFRALNKLHTLVSLYYVGLLFSKDCTQVIIFFPDRKTCYVLPARLTLEIVNIYLYHWALSSSLRYSLIYRCSTISWPWQMADLRCYEMIYENIKGKIKICSWHLFPNLWSTHCFVWNIPVTELSALESFVSVILMLFQLLFIYEWLCQIIRQHCICLEKIWKWFITYTFVNFCLCFFFYLWL